MKVLMFGWEFPPHISGGLGTACYGLTQSLTRQSVDILFVTPKAENPAPFPGATIISAGSVAIPGEETEHFSETVSEGQFMIACPGSMQTIGIASSLQPYHSVDFNVALSIDLDCWHYQPYTERSLVKESRAGKSTYRFLGGYGPQLMAEIERYAEVAAQVAKDNSFDVIHAHDWMTYPAGIAARQASGKPLVIHVHATEFDRSGEDGNAQVREIERMGMNRSDRIIAVSQLTKDIIVSRYHISPDKVEVVYNGVLPKGIDLGSSRPALDRRVITFLGRVTHQKGPGYFVDAAYWVHQKLPDVHFVMAGSGDLLSKMMKKVAQLNLSSHFHFTGFLDREKVDEVWSMSDMYVMPSVSEPFGIAPLEAMRAGVPVIISNQSGVAEVVNHAIKVNFWDIEALANAMLSLLTHKSLAKMVRRNGTEEISKINWDVAAEKVNRIYHEVTARN